MNKDAVFLGDWAEDGLEAMVADFQSAYDKDEMHDLINHISIIVATYTYENYSGNAFVLYEKDGKLYEVNGSHCSCNGLEDQWDPEETTLEALKKRFGVNDSWYYEAEERCAILEAIKKYEEKLNEASNTRT